ncbi:MAG: hypothetical protein J6Y08_08030 [Clostridiales bacterium]|nr:hypothetical protein [Clostridiales bacterium]
MAICKLCNHENPDDSKFCLNCGNALEDVISDASAQSAPAPQPEVLQPTTAEVISQTPAVIPPAPGQLPPQGQSAPQPQPYVAVEGPNSQHYENANSVPFNYRDQQEYAQRMANPNKVDHENVCVLALVFGILGFFFNPLYLISLTAIILGVIGHANQGSKKTLGMIGWILGICSFVTQLILDIFCTFGFGIFC